VIAFETSARIKRPVEHVFSYVSDPLNFSALELSGPMRPEDVGR
jgi:hypothetical protein